MPTRFKEIWPINLGDKLKLKPFSSQSSLRLFGALGTLGLALSLASVCRAEPTSETKKFQRSKLTNDASESLADKRRILLATGEDRAVDLDFEANAGANGITVGNPSTVATTLVKINEKRQIIFKPLKEGNTTVTVRDLDGTIRLIFNVRVTGSNLLRLANEIRDLIRDIEGVAVRIVGKKIVIDGEVLVPNDYARLLGVIQDASYSPDVLNLVTVSPFALQLLAKRIQDDIQAFAPNVKTRVVNGMIWLEGTVDSDDLAKRAVQVARLYLPEARPGNQLIAKDTTASVINPPRELVQTFIVINAAPPRKQEKLVRITMHFVELAKNYSKVFGFRWSPGFTSDPQITIGTTTAGGTGASGGSSFTATISSLFPRLSSAQTAGYARILKTATVIVRSGQKAQLTDLVEFPQISNTPNGPVSAGKLATGLDLAVFPSILGQSEDIQLNIQVQQQNPVGRNIAGSGPAAVASHKVETNLYVKSGESAALAGIQNSTVNTDFNKEPGGAFSGQTQPLFNLSASKDYQKGRSQFVIFVTPQIIENASEGTEDLKKNFRVRVK